MYKVGMVDGIILIYNSNIRNIENSIESGQYIGRVNLPISPKERSVLSVIDRATAWNYDSHLTTESSDRVDRGSCTIPGETVEGVFFRLQLALTEFGFEGIMDLELPEELLGA